MQGKFLFELDDFQFKIICPESGGDQSCTLCPTLSVYVDPFFFFLIRNLNKLISSKIGVTWKNNTGVNARGSGITPSAEGYMLLLILQKLLILLIVPLHSSFCNHWSTAGTASWVFQSFCHSRTSENFTFQKILFVKPLSLKLL